jgi:hypothetical protein
MQKNNYRNKDIQKVEAKKIKVNKVRTRLSVYLGQENSKYLKNCEIKFNSQYLREIVKKYDQCMKVILNNPIIK